MAARNFGQVLENLSFYQNKEQKSWLDKIKGYWKPETQPSKEEKSFLGSIASSIKKKGTDSMNVINNATQRTARLKYFFIFIALSIGLFVGSFTFLPMVLLFPQKFALLFSLASLTMQIALSYLKPTAWDYIKALFSSKENLVVSFVYFFSILWTIYSAAILGSYIMVCISATIQMFAIGWYIFSMFPGGYSGFLNLLKYGCKLCPCFSGDSLLPL